MKKNENIRYHNQNFHVSKTKFNRKSEIGILRYANCINNHGAQNLQLPFNEINPFQ